MGRRKRFAAAVVISLTLENKNAGKMRKKRSCWVREWILRREFQGANNNLVQELRIEDPNQYKNFFRMTAADIEYLITQIGPQVAKQDTAMRPAISVKERLFVTLRFLATGEYTAGANFVFVTKFLFIQNLLQAIAT
jgi:hypothetical protein